MMNIGARLDRLEQRLPPPPAGDLVVRITRRDAKPPHPKLAVIVVPVGPDFREGRPDGPR